MDLSVPAAGAQAYFSVSSLNPLQSIGNIRMKISQYDPLIISRHQRGCVVQDYREVLQGGTTGRRTAIHTIIIIIIIMTAEA